MDTAIRISSNLTVHFLTNGKKEILPNIILLACFHWLMAMFFRNIAHNRFLT